MPKYGQSFYTFMTFSTMHLGLSYHENRLVEAGVWVLKKWRQSRALQQLSMSDYSKDQRETFLYKLSLQPGLELFRHVVFASSWQDQYAPFDSARSFVPRGEGAVSRAGQPLLGDSRKESEQQHREQRQMLEKRGRHQLWLEGQRGARRATHSCRIGRG